MASLTVTAEGVWSLRAKRDVLVYSYEQVRGKSKADYLNPDGYVGQEYDINPPLGAGDNAYGVFRLGLVFDASALPDNAVISAAKIRLYCTGDSSTTDFDVTVVSGRGISPSAETKEDYGILFNARTSFGLINTSAITVSAYNDITLNAAGIADISVTGKTLFGVRSSRDIEGNIPDKGPPDVDESVMFDDSTPNLPELVITYTSASPAVNTDAATSITTTGATLNGTLVDDGGAAKDCNFEWGRTTNYGNATATQSKTTGETFAQALTGLLPNTLYHFRALADGVNGADRTFQTLSPVAGASPTIVSGLVGALRFDFGPGRYNLEIGLGGYGRAFSTTGWGHYGVPDPEMPPDFSGPPPTADDICAQAQEAWNTWQQFTIHPPIGMTPEQRAEWETQKNRLWNIYMSLHAACSLARRTEGGASGVNQ